MADVLCEGKTQQNITKTGFELGSPGQKTTWFTTEPPTHIFIHWFSIDKGQHFILVCLFELMLNAPFNSYFQAETLPPIHEAFIQN